MYVCKGRNFREAPAHVVGSWVEIRSGLTIKDRYATAKKLFARILPDECADAGC